VKSLACDLHVHTALSACAAREMTPPDIVATARERGLDMIAVCDHNSAGNAAAVQQAAGERLGVVAGMEITTAEEVHVLGYFPDADRAAAAATKVAASLPDTDEEYARYFGEHDLLAADGSPRGAETKALASATSLTLAEAVTLIKEHGGLAVAAHVDRRAFGVVAQLGFFPRDAGFDAVEVSWRVRDAAQLAVFEAYGLPLLTSSDGHFLDDIGRARSRATVAAATFAELALAVRDRDGRSIHRA